MLLKQSWEYSSPDFINLKFEFWALPKAVTVVKPCLRCIIHPIGLQPVNNIIVTRKEYDLPFATSPCLSECGCSNFCYLPIDNGSKLIHNGMFRSFTCQTCQPGTEFWSNGVLLPLVPTEGFALNEGENEIVITANWGYSVYDCIYIEKIQEN